MIHRHAAALRLVVTTLLLVFVAAGSLRAQADSADTVARRFIGLAYEGDFQGLPRSEHAKTETFERSVRNSLRVRCIHIEAIELLESSVAPDGITILYNVALYKSERQPPHSWYATDVFPLRLQLVSESGTWRVSAVEFDDSKLADQLIAADDEGRRQLLIERPDRITRSLARALYERALRQLNTGKFDAARGAALLSREIAVESFDRGGEALANGILMFTESNPAEASRLSVESLAIAESTGDPDVLARAWYNRGRSLGAEEQAECFQKASTFAERAEDPTLLIRTLYSLANGLANRESDYVNARRYVDRVLPLARDIGDVAGELGLESVLSTIYFAQDDYERGMFHHSRALQLAEQHGLYAYWSLLLRSGSLLVGQRRFDEARRIFDKALARDASGKVTARVPVPGGHLGAALQAMAMIEAHAGNFSEAECLSYEAGMLSGRGNDVYDYLLAHPYLARGDYVSALRSSLASLAEPRLYDDERIAALDASARALRRLGQSGPAMAAILEAIDLRESINLNIAGDEQQRAHASDMTAGHYELAAELALERGELASALAFLDRGRGSVLTDILENGRPGAIAAAETVKDAEQLRQEREMVRLSVDLDRSRAASDESGAQKLREQLQQARARHATLVDGIRARSERRLSTRRHMDERALIDLNPLPMDLAAVTYLVADEKLQIFVVRREGLANRVLHHEVDVSRKTLDDQVDQFLEGLSQQRLDVRASARTLYKLLVEPIERDLAFAGVLLIIPDEMLWRVPFAALVDTQGRYVVERWASIYAPSMTSYSVAASNTHRRSKRSSLFAVGNPALDDRSKQSVESFYRGANLDALPDAEREVDEIARLYDSSQSIVLKREQATERRTKSSLAGASIVHFATHALFDDANPMYSRLALARDSDGSEDGWLESWEITQLDLDADMVVLSACETARGRIGGGEGVVGIAWSFFLAGARSTVATQWKVASDSTAVLMHAFHRELQNDEAFTFRKARSLRAAQLRLLRDRLFKHPFHWAPFVLLGDPS